VGPSRELIGGVSAFDVVPLLAEKIGDAHTPLSAHDSVPDSVCVKVAIEIPKRRR